MDPADVKRVRDAVVSGEFWQASEPPTELISAGLDHPNSAVRELAAELLQLLEAKQGSSVVGDD